MFNPIELPPRYNHSYIMNTIGRVSSRFECLARDQSLWKGNVSIDWSDTKSVDYKETLDKSIDSFLGDGARELEFNRKKMCFSFGLKSGLRINFDSVTCLKFPFLNFLSL